jgi:hypothetical protein
LNSDKDIISLTSLRNFALFAVKDYWKTSHRATTPKRAGKGNEYIDFTKMNMIFKEKNKKPIYLKISND